MAIIDKIRLSGTTYDLVDQSKAKVIEVTQQQYDAIVTPEANAIYVITDAPSIDISDFYNKSTINGMMALKQDTLVSGTNIKTINNESILGSGNLTIEGGAYNAGTNISIANDTVSCTLPITAGSHSTNKGIIIGDSECSSTGAWSVAIGHNADATGQASIVMGENIGSSAYYSLMIGRTAYGQVLEGSYSASIGEANNLSGTSRKCRFAFGGYLSPKNDYETGFGYQSQSYTASTTFGNSGNTLFTIGNGYSYQSTNNPHNAFEVRQSGDIYVANTDDTTDTSSTGYSTKPMVRLQDTITATAANTAALSGKQDVLVSGTNIKTINNESILGSGNITIQGGGSVTIDPTLDSGSTNAVANSAITAAIDAVNASLSGKVNTSAVTSSVTSSSTDVVTSGGVYAQLDGIKLRKVTESQWSTISGSTDASTLYVVIPDPNQA